MLSVSLFPLRSTRSEIPPALFTLYGANRKPFIEVLDRTQRRACVYLKLVFPQNLTFTLLLITFNIAVTFACLLK